MKTMSWHESVEKISGAGINSKFNTFKNNELESKFSASVFYSKRRMLQFFSIFFTSMHVLLEMQNEDFLRLFGPYVTNEPNGPNARMHPIWHGALFQAYDPNNTDHVARKKQGDEWIVLVFNLRLASIAIPCIYNLIFFIALMSKRTFSKLLVLFWFFNMFAPIFMSLSVSASLPYANIPMFSSVIIWYAALSGGFTFKTSFKVSFLFFFLHCCVGSIVLSQLSESTNLPGIRRLKLVIGHLSPFLVGLYAARVQELILRKNFILDLVGNSKSVQTYNKFTLKGSKESEETYNAFFNEKYILSSKRYFFIISFLLFVNGVSLMDAPEMMKGTLINVFGLMLAMTLALLAFSTIAGQKFKNNLQKISSFYYLFLFICQVYIVNCMASFVGGELIFTNRLVRFVYYSVATQGVVRIIQHGSSSFAIRFIPFMTLTSICLLVQFLSVEAIYNYSWPTQVSNSSLVYYGRFFKNTAYEFCIFSILTFILSLTVVRQKEITTRSALR